MIQLALSPPSQYQGDSHGRPCRLSASIHSERLNSFITVMGVGAGRKHLEKIKSWSTYRALIKCNVEVVLASVCHCPLANLRGAYRNGSRSSRRSFFGRGLSDEDDVDYLSRWLPCAAEEESAITEEESAITVDTLSDTDKQ